MPVVFNLSKFLLPLLTIFGKNMKITKLTLGLISGISLLAFPLTTFAAEDDDSANVIEEITVTARKREESVLDIPESVSAISGTDIEKQGIKGLDKIGLLYQT